MTSMTSIILSYVVVQELSELKLELNTSQEQMITVKQFYYAGFISFIHLESEHSTLCENFEQYIEIEMLCGVDT